MRKVKTAKDFNGNEVRRGDVVSTLDGRLTAKVCDIAMEMDKTTFVRLRPVHSPFDKGIWHAAEHVQWVSGGRKYKVEDELADVEV